MKSVLRIIMVVALLVTVSAITAPVPAAALSQADMAVVGGSGCSVAEGAAIIFGIAGFANPIFGAVSLGLAVGVVIWC